MFRHQLLSCFLDGFRVNYKYAEVVELGRHARFRTSWAKALAGSTPVLGTFYSNGFLSIGYKSGDL